MAIIAGVIFAVLALILRLVPHSPNFVPVAALALWGGVYLPKKLGLAFPLAVMFLSDALIGFYDWRLMSVVYVSFAVAVLIGWWVKSGRSATKIVLGSLAGSMFFFLATNFAVWAFSSWYPHTLAGLFEAYALGVPFFRNTIVGDLFYNVMFFGSYALALAFIKRKENSSLDLGARIG